MAPPSMQMEEQAPIVRKEEGVMTRMFRKIKQDPAVPIGMAGWTGLVGYGLYNVKNRKERSLSLYLISLRVKAQAFAIGCMTVAVAWNIFKHFRDGTPTYHRSQPSILPKPAPPKN